MTPSPKKSARLSEEVLPGVRRIVLPLPGKKPGPVNTYLFTGDPVTLLDTGTAKAHPVLEAALAEMGMTPDSIQRIVLTHGHMDHYGAARKIIRTGQTRPPILVHPADARAVETGRDCSMWTSERFLRLCGVPLGVRAAMRAIFFVFDTMAQTARVSRFIQEDEVIRLGQYRARVVHTPGHTRGSVCFHLPEERVLFSGDHILPHITPNALVMLDEDTDIPTRRAQDEFYESLDRVEALAPRLVLPAHGRAMEDFPEIAAMYRRTFNDRQDLTLNILRQGPQTVYQTASRLFPDIPKNIRFVLEMYLAVSEAYTHIQVLEHKGLAKTQRKRKCILVSA